MSKPDTGEVTISLGLVGAAIAISQISAPEALKYSGITFLFVIWVFIHFQWYHNQHNTRQAKKHQIMIEKNQLDSYLKNGFIFIASLEDGSKYIIEGPLGKKND